MTILREYTRHSLTIRSATFRGLRLSRKREETCGIYNLPTGTHVLTKIDPIEVLGLIAGVLTTTAYVPQVFRTWRLKTAGDISLLTISLTSAGIFLWFLYGLYIGSLSVTIANLITCVLTLTVLVMKIRYGKNRE